MRRLFRSVLFVANILCLVLLLLAKLSSYILPNGLLFIYILSYGFPFLYVLNFFFCCFWLYRKRKRFLFSLAVLILTYGQWGTYFQFFGNNENDLTQLNNSVSIMSFNVRMLNRYNWTGDKHTIEHIQDFVAKENPDILCIQEFFVNNRNRELSENTIFSKFKEYEYKHIEYNILTKDGKKFGLATFSKYPIVNKDYFNYSESNNLSAQTDIDVNGKVIRVFNNHLESYRLGNEDYELINNIQNMEEVSRKEGIKSISNKLSTGLRERVLQAQTLSQHISNSTLPVVSCGDFNDIPSSYVYRTVRGDLSDAFVDSGAGFGGTYNGKLPSFRIDFIFFDEKFKAYNFKRFKENLSDHYPISTVLELD